MFRVMQIELPVEGMNYNFLYNELQTVVDFYGNSIAYIYDKFYRIQRVAYSADETYDYIWDNNYYLLSKKYSPDLIIEYKRNPIGFPTEINRFGIKTQIRLDSRYKKPLEFIYDDGKQELFEYDDLGNLLSVLKPGNRYMVFDYQNDLIDYIDFYGVFSVNLSYNITDDLNFIRVPQNKRIIVDYDKDKNITSLFNFNNDRYVLSYTNSLLSNIALPNNTNLLFEYNNNSQLRKATNPIGLVTNFDFDVLNRLIAINNSYSIEYDLNNFQIINFARDTCKYELDLLKRIVSKTSPIGLTEHFQWGTAGNLAGYSRNSQHNYSFSYNNNNRLSLYIYI